MAERNQRAQYRLATYQTKEGPRAGLIIGDDVFDAAKVTGKAAYATVAGILADWKAAEVALKKAAAGAAKSRAKRQPLTKTKLSGAARLPADDLLRRRQLCRSRRRHGAQSGPAGARRSARTGTKAMFLHQGGAHARRSGRHHQSRRLRQTARLGDRTCGHHRPASEECADRQGAELCRGLYGGQRPLRARPRAAAGR